MAVVITSTVANVAVIEHTIFVTNEVVVWSARAYAVLRVTKLVAAVIVDEAEIPHAGLLIRHKIIPSIT